MIGLLVGMLRADNRTEEDYVQHKISMTMTIFFLMDFYHLLVCFHFFFVSFDCLWKCLRRLYFQSYRYLLSMNYHCFSMRCARITPTLRLAWSHRIFFVHKIIRLEGCTQPLSVLPFDGDDTLSICYLCVIGLFSCNKWFGYLVTCASFSLSPAFLRNPCSSALMPFPVSYDHLYEPSMFISCSWLMIGMGVVVVSPFVGPWGAHNVQPKRAVNKI